MNANHYCYKLRSKNPQLFAATKIQITPDNLEKLVRQAYEEGYKNGITSKSLFETLFGK